MNKTPFIPRPCPPHGSIPDRHHRGRMSLAWLRILAGAMRARVDSWAGAAVLRAETRTTMSMLGFRSVFSHFQDGCGLAIDPESRRVLVVTPYGAAIVAASAIAAWRVPTSGDRPDPDGLWLCMHDPLFGDVHIGFRRPSRLRRCLALLETLCRVDPTTAGD